MKKFPVQGYEKNDVCYEAKAHSELILQLHHLQITFNVNKSHPTNKQEATMINTQQE